LRDKAGTVVALRKGTITGTVKTESNKAGVSIALKEGPEFMLSIDQLDADDVVNLLPLEDGEGKAEELRRRGMLFLTAGDVAKAEEYLTRARDAGAGKSSARYLEQIAALKAEKREAAALDAWKKAEGLFASKSWKAAQQAYQALQRDYAGSVTLANNTATLAKRLEAIDAALAPVEKGLVGWWKLDESSGVVAMDSSGQKHNGALINGPQWTAGKLGGALKFNSDAKQSMVVNDVAVNTAPGGKNTAAFWMKWDGANEQIVLGFDGGLNLSMFGSSFGINSGSGDYLGIASTGLAGRWVHVAVVFSNGASENSKLYIDGVAQKLNQINNPFNCMVTARITLSGWGTDARFKFGGALDDLRIYDHELTAAEVAALAAASEPAKGH